MYLLNITGFMLHVLCVWQDAVPEQRAGLRLCDLAQADGVADQFCDRARGHFTWQ